MGACVGRVVALLGIALAAPQRLEVLARDAGGLAGLVDVGGHRRSSSSGSPRHSSIRCPSDDGPHPQARGRPRRELLPGVWRLRLPLPWPGVPHCNAWAVGTGDGIVLFDTGMHEPGSMAHLERALDMVGLKVEHVRLLVCTHAHSDHYGQAATIVARAGCELWMHPDHAT